MRGNGLSADAYVAVADLDPGTADALLAALRDRGVAAYAAASPEPVPEGDTDRLYVDVAAVEQARALIHVELTGTDDPDEDWPEAGSGGPPAERPDDGRDMDAEFAAIVASFHATPAAHRPWPAAEDVPSDRMPTTTDRHDPFDPQLGAGGVGGAAEGDPGDSGASVMGWEDLLRPVPVPEPEPEPGYVPPPPPPLPETSVGTRFAWAAVLGGPAVLFAAVLLGWHLADWMMLAAALAFLGGFAALVARLGDRPDDPDDDGAVI